MIKETLKHTYMIYMIQIYLKVSYKQMVSNLLLSDGLYSNFKDDKNTEEINVIETACAGQVFRPI